ncbi:aminoglycoside phosphotransferase [Yinghuangia soli]|uniref:Aminoglycoside phosphotransferase n=1 Tax=Yinghuangia soli TaxID=2908204 RepID=A0AA41TZU2_9ACTN|nr:aminoglycoside phosphotransferase [Yinghuangia soli]MCF2527866.1 aminoglycoside phosphotransferase [Yinghuangia soli]
MSERTSWEQMPAAVHDAVTARFGAFYTSHEATGGGSDSDCTSWVYLNDGDALFAKGVLLHHVDKLQRLDLEAAINPWTPSCTPRLRGRIRTAGWDVLLFEVVGTREWAVFEPDWPDLPLVATALDSLSRCAAPPLPLATLRDRWEDFCEPSDQPLLTGGALVHSDPAATNFVMSDDQAYLVDWTNPLLGPAWADAMLWGMRLISDGGQTPEQAAEWTAKVPAFATAPREAVRVATLAEARMCDAFADPGQPHPMAAAAHAWAAHWS